MKEKFTFFCMVFSVFINMNTATYAQAVNVQDSLALVDLYKSTNGLNWINNTNWLMGPVSTWYGITVSNGRVTNIFLGVNNLDGNIPSSIGNFDKLDTLILSTNKLTGTIPSETGNLFNLKYLILGYNQLSGGIPSELGKLVNLNTIWLDNNQLSGAIPSSIGDLANLKVLGFSFNQLNGSIPYQLGNLVNLQELILGFNQLNGAIPPELGDLVNLNTLWLNNNQLSGPIPPELGTLKSELSLDLTSNRFTFDGMELIAQTFSNAYYNPQANIPIHQNGKTLSVSAGGTLTNNLYQWFKDHQYYTTISDDSVFHPSKAVIIMHMSSIQFVRNLYSIPIRLIMILLFKRLISRIRSHLLIYTIVQMERIGNTPGY